jgi:FHS family L-fucose permease-like MFS transporter
MQAMTPDMRSSRYIALISVTAIFAIWGLAQWVYNALSPQFTQFFQLNASQAAWAQSLLNIAYFALAIPAAMFHRKFGYKLGVIFALSSFSLGPFLLYAALTQHGYLFYFAAIVVMGAGWAWLETATNPLAIELGRNESAITRLNFAQAFYPVGLVAGSYVAQWVLSSNYQLPIGELAPAVARPYVFVGLGVLLMAFAIDKVSFPGSEIRKSGSLGNVRDEIRSLLLRRDFRLGALALLAYVLALSDTWGVTYRYAMQELPGATAPVAGQMVLWAFTILAIGRFVGTAIMVWVDPMRLLTWCAALAAVLISVAALLGGVSGLACLMASSLFMAIMYATIFGATIRNLGLLMKIGAGLLVMAAGLAGALAPLLMKALTDVLSVRAVTLMPLPFLAMILGYAIHIRTKQLRASSDAQQSGIPAQAS